MFDEIQNILNQIKSDLLLLHNSDQFFLEYIPESEKRIEFISNFTGSNATIIFSLSRFYFFTDSRYLIQARDQLDLRKFEVIDVANISVLSWLKDNLKRNQKLSAISNLTKTSFAKELQNLFGNQVSFLENNPIDQIWDSRPEPIRTDLFFCDNSLTGLNSITKRNLVTKNLGAEILFISRPEELCWLLNIRASDVQYSPLFTAYALLFANGDLELFVDVKRILDIGNDNLEKVIIFPPDNFANRISQLSEEFQYIQIDENWLNYQIYQNIVQSSLEIVNQKSPIDLIKAKKNQVEINGMINAHIFDGVALTKFLFWFDNNIKKSLTITEISAVEKLLSFRSQNNDFLYPSFSTISSFASNGAIVHYAPSQETNKIIKGNSIYLVDSGGQYCGEKAFGTTDVTRSVIVGNPTAEMIQNFTKVLKGHIALAGAKFKPGTSGADLDILARQFLQESGLDYGHGTGHGVGCFLSVHEGPCGIGKNYQEPLEEGMIISNEPGFYKEGEYGIRIENLLLVEKLENNLLGFKTITLAPIDLRLVDINTLTDDEKAWLNNYHLEIINQLRDYLSKEELKWVFANIIN